MFYTSSINYQDVTILTLVITVYLQNVQNIDYTVI